MRISLFYNILLAISIISVFAFYVEDRCDHLPLTEDFGDPLFDHTQIDSIFNFNPEFYTNGFDFPVGKPNAENYYLASKFGQRNHLGEDWNGVGGGNTDLGDPVYAVSNGVVAFTEDVCCGWGNVVRVIHKLENNQKYQYLETVYAHLDRIDVHPGQLLKRGALIGTIGNAHGAYKAHLHLELRDFINMSLGPGYSDDHFGYLDPSQFILSNRP